MSNAPAITVSLGDFFLVLSDRPEYDAQANRYEVVKGYDETLKAMVEIPAYRGSVCTQEFAGEPKVRLEQTLAIGGNLYGLTWGENDDEVYDAFFPVGVAS